ncbi:MULTISPECIES: DUF2905 domain-containing protein [unclassified Siphonobacter]|uniref:DUF2905 domain-containing protein n=1 Tax=unclassified Siphonobacter TaxID=2635712 RepID=UPI000CBB6B04|nr:MULTISPECIES: DUF2905 domain-containing protein [unclassified Siphonobacter]MDQ1086551.1 hypothetical protein [Siphonobacter sp. SORGH_AS_1065]PKK36029.1 hypothetical protein BWI96_13475 [Siphonobacter sp. SORGH_AS_0500]
MNPNLGKGLIILGGIVMVLGIVIYFFHDKLHWIGRLPGDLRLERENVRIYMPIATCILVTIILNVILWLIRRLF